jgi:hypothetical protein
MFTSWSARRIKSLMAAASSVVANLIITIAFMTQAFEECAATQGSELAKSVVRMGRSCSDASGRSVVMSVGIGH